MAEEIIKVKVSQLPMATVLDNLEILGVDKSTNKSVRAAMSLLRGLDGKPVELRESETHVQWRVSGGTWANLVALADLQGPPGRAFVYSDFTTAQLNALKVKGDPGASPELSVSATHIQWRLAGSSTWINLKELSELEGAQGKNIELQPTATHVQWRVSGGTWANLVALADLQGPPGGSGKTTQFRIGAVSKTLPGGVPEVTITGTSQDANGNPIRDINFKLPTGDTGPGPVISIGTVGTVAPGGQSSATLVSDGTTPEGAQKYKLNLVLVQGATGSVENIETIAIAFSDASTRTNISSGDTIAVMFGKIKKWFTDLKALAFKDKVNWNTDVDNRPASMPASDVSAWAKAANKPAYSATEVGALPDSHNTDGSAHADIRSEVASVRLVAEGAVVAFAFDTVAAMNSWIAVPANKSKLKVGSPLYIRATNVPDYWWDGTQALMVEGEKVDLTGYLLTSVANNTYVAKEAGKSLMTDAERTKLNGIANNANNYTHPTGSGNNHVPAGGASGQILRYSSAGTAAWGAENNTTYSPATTSVDGLMSKEDKTKLDGLKFQVVASLPASPDPDTFYFIPE